MQDGIFEQEEDCKADGITRKGKEKTKRKNIYG